MTDRVLLVDAPLSVDDYTPALYFMFPSPEVDVWARVTLRMDVVEATLGHAHNVQERYLGILGFTEWVNDQAYYGDWWRTAGVTLYSEKSTAAAETIIANATATPDPETVGYTPVGTGHGSEVYDFRGTFVGTEAFGSSTRSIFDTEAWHNGVHQWSRRFHCTIDTGKTPYSGFQAFTIPNRYGFPSASKLYLDDISVGTTRGGSDIMDVVTFDDGTFGALTVDDGDTAGMVDSFSIFTPAGGGQRFQASVI